MYQVFVNQKYHKNGQWINNVHVKEAETMDEAIMLAKHQFHAFMSTYAYNNNEGTDYVSCSVECLDGLFIVEPEVDNRMIFESIEEPELE